MTSWVIVLKISFHILAENFFSYSSVPRILVHSHNYQDEKFGSVRSYQQMESRKANWNLQNPWETEKFFEKMQNSLETANNLETAKRSGKCETLALLDMGGGGGGMMAPQKRFSSLCPKALEEEAETW